ncbi:MAG: GFA family protein [Hyphomicrobium sp.]
MSQPKSYDGGCHCGAVRFAVTMSLDDLITCNCSICQKRGSILGFVPAPAFELASGGESLTDYQFNRRAIHHAFCKTCGVASFARGEMPDGTAMVGVNVRCLDGVDAWSLSAKQFDGKSL